MVLLVTPKTYFCIATRATVTKDQNDTLVSGKRPCSHESSLKPIVSYMKEFEVKTKGLGINPKDGLTEGLTGNADDASGIQTWVDLLKSIEKKLVQFVLEKNRLVLKIVPKG